MNTTTQQIPAKVVPPRRSVAAISDMLKSLSEAETRSAFDLPGTAVLLKSTISTCPCCLAQTEAVVFEQGGRALMRTRCPIHGITESLIENDATFYRLSNKDRYGVRFSDARPFDIPEYANCCAGGCAPQSKTPIRAENPDFYNQIGNKTCTVLLEVTNACNLACRVCYADARGDRIVAMEEIRGVMTRLIQAQGFLDSVQITGGEATIHPQFWEIVGWLCQQDGIGKVYLPTNGIELSKPGVARSLEKWRDKLLVLLQFDGASSDTNRSLRRADTFRVREKTIRTLERLGICMQLTMTIAQDISETEIAWVVRQGLRHRHIRLVGMLPTFYTGRYELPADPMRRPTLSTVVKAVAAAMPAKVSADDFVPIPCSHPNCGWTTLFARRFGLLFNITQKIDLEAVMNEVAYKTVLDKREIHSVIGGGRSSLIGRLLTRMGRMFIRPRDVFGIAIKPFMDRYTYDHDRVANCCHQILDTNGNLVSFCEYNTRLRDVDSWTARPRLTGEHAPVADAVRRSFEDA